MKLIIIPLVTALFVFFAVSPSAQEITGKIEGRTLDQEGKPVPFVTVTVSGPDLQGVRTVLSASNGYFILPHIPVGTYAVKFSHVSYQEVTHEDVRVRLGQTTTLPRISLVPLLHEAPPIVVTERQRLVDVTSTTIGANLASRESVHMLLSVNPLGFQSVVDGAQKSEIVSRTGTAACERDRIVVVL